MKMKAAGVLCMIAGFLAIALPSIPAFAASPAINVLLIHGRWSPCQGFPYTAGSCSNPETFETFTVD